MQYPLFVTSGVATVAGELVLAFTWRGGQTAKVTQVTAEMPAGAGAACSLRLNGVLISALVPTGDAASGDPPLFIGPSDELTVEWTGAPAGAPGRMGVIYEIGAPA